MPTLEWAISERICPNDDGPYPWIGTLEAAFAQAVRAAQARRRTLEKAQQRFTALAKVEERHLRHCQSVLATLAA
jgi:hypothetical protein